jgi:8-oxo-dGTP diphosphatase
MDLLSLQSDAEAEGRQCLAGALILDEQGRAFVHRRGWERSLFPGCWDIVGGHVEPGETLLEALEREVEEETGWRLTGTPALSYVGDWETSGEDGTTCRREFDFVVEVDGDLANPRLEVPHHVEYRWLGRGELALLDENRGLDDGMIRQLVELALRRGQPGPHVTAFLDPAAGEQVEPLRAAWDPAMAGQIAAHVTIAYPSELGDLDEPPEIAVAAPFRLRLGRLALDRSAGDWVYAEVDDVDGGWRLARERLLGRRARTGVRPHVTVVHPRTTNRGLAAWSAIGSLELDAEFEVDELELSR